MFLVRWIQSLFSLDDCSPLRPPEDWSVSESTGCPVYPIHAAADDWYETNMAALTSCGWM